MSDRITYECNDGIGLMRLDDGKANVIQPDWCRELNACLDCAEEDDSTAVVVIGRPGFFSGGLDLGVFPKLRGSDLLAATDLFLDSMKRCFLFPKPLIAAATGHTIAGGMMFYLAADYRLALDDDRFQFGLNEAITGVPFLGGTAGICGYAIPPQHQTEIVLHGRMLTARQFHARGIVEALASSSEELLSSALARASELQNLHLPTYRTNKLILRREAYESAVRIAESLKDHAPSGNVFENIGR
jgi:enoyl-CoA hydratase